MYLYTYTDIETGQSAQHVRDCAPTAEEFEECDGLVLTVTEEGPARDRRSVRRER